VTASRRDIAISALQYGVGIAALAFLLSQVDVQAVATRLRATEPAVLVALVLVTVAGVAARFDTWRAVLAPFARVPLLTAGRVDLAVNFVNQLLPSRLSGRLAAPFILKAETGVDYGDATAAAGVHTGIYAVCYGLVSAVGLGEGEGAGGDTDAVLQGRNRDIAPARRHAPPPGRPRRGSLGPSPEARRRGRTGR